MQTMRVEPPRIAQRGGDLGDAGAQPADHVVLLDGHGHRRTLEDRRDPLRVERLELVDVDDPHAHPGTLHRLGGIKRGPDHDPGGDQRRVCPRPHDVHRTVAVVLRERVGIVDRHVRAPAEPDVNRPVVIGGCPHDTSTALVVADGHHPHPGHRAHRGQILGRVVRRAQVAQRDAGVGGQDAHRQMGIGHIGAQVLKGEQPGEAGEGREVGPESRRRHSRRGADHGALRDAELKEPLGKAILELRELRHVLEVGGARNDSLISLSELDEHLAGDEAIGAPRTAAVVKAAGIPQVGRIASAHVAAPIDSMSCSARSTSAPWR